MLLPSRSRIRVRQILVFFVHLIISHSINIQRKNYSVSFSFFSQVSLGHRICITKIAMINDLDHFNSVWIFPIDWNFSRCTLAAQNIFSYVPLSGRISDMCFMKGHVYSHSVWELRSFICPLGSLLSTLVNLAITDRRLARTITWRRFWKISLGVASLLVKLPNVHLSYKMYIQHYFSNAYCTVWSNENDVLTLFYSLCSHINHLFQLYMQSILKNQG